VSPTRTPTYTYAAVFGVGLLVLTAPLAGVTLLDFHTTELQSAAEDEVEAVLEEPQYAALESDDVEVILDGDYPIQSVERVVVTVSGREPGPHPGLADRLYEAIRPHSDDSLIVEVQYVVAQERGGNADGRKRSGPRADRRNKTYSVVSPTISHGLHAVSRAVRSGIDVVLL